MKKSFIFYLLLVIGLCLECEVFAAARSSAAAMAAEDGDGDASAAVAVALSADDGGVPVEAEEASVAAMKAKIAREKFKAAVEAMIKKTMKAMTKRKHVDGNNGVVDGEAGEAKAAKKGRWDNVADEAKAEEQPTCSICTKKYRPINPQIAIHGSTGGKGALHGFHGDCILEWFKNSLTCPLCRVEIPEDKRQDIVIMLEELEEARLKELVSRIGLENLVNFIVSGHFKRLS